MKRTLPHSSFLLIIVFLLFFTNARGQTVIFGPQDFATWLPTDWANQNISGNNWTQNTADGVASTNCAQMSGSTASNSWLFTESFTAVAGQSYYVGYFDKYTNNGLFEIYAGTGAKTSANATQSSNLRNAAQAGSSWAAAEKNSVSWLCPLSGTYWFAIHCTNATATVKLDKISCYKDCSTNTITATTAQTNLSTISTCYDNAEILSIVVNATIDNCASVSSFTVNANGTTNIADIKNARIWYTGASPLFSTNADFGSTATLFGTVAGPTLADFAISGSQSLHAGNNYFWLTFDVKSTATPGNVIDAECTSINDGSTITPSITAPSGNRAISMPTTLPASFRTCATGTILELGNAEIAANTFSVPVGGSALTNPLGATCNLREVRVRFYGGSNEMPDKYTVTIKAPDGTSMVLFSNAFAGITAGSLDARFRYSANLVQASASNYASGFTQPVEPFNQGFYCSQNNFNVFSGTNPAGTWNVVITESAAVGNDDFKLDYVELIFGPDFTETNVRASGDQCSSAIGLSNGIYLGSTAYNPGAGDAKTVESWDPATTLGGCNWNGSNDNSQWFVFYATKTRVTLSISGLLYNGVVNNKLQSIVVENQATPCAGTGTDWTMVSCPVAESYSSNAGTYANHKLDFAATIGATYYLVIDGTAGGLNNFYIDADGVAPPPNPLPVELIHFNGNCSENTIEIEWQTASETNNDYFVVERSEDGNQFLPIGVIPGNGNSNTVLSYHFSDYNNTRPENYYRLKQVDYDGQSELSNIIHVAYDCNQGSGAQTLTAFYRPESGQIMFSLGISENTDAQVIMTDVAGRIICQNRQQLTEGWNSFNTTVKIRSALYFLSVRTDEHTLTQKVFINQ